LVDIFLFNTREALCRFQSFDHIKNSGLIIPLNQGYQFASISILM